MPVVFIPPNLRPLTNGTETVDVEGANIRAVIANLDEQFPGIRQHLCDGDNLQSGLVVAVGGDVASLGIRQPVNANDEIHFLPAIGGG